MSLGEDELLLLIRALHEGAMDPGAWLRALELLSQAFGGASLLAGITPDGIGSFALAGFRMARESVSLINGALANRIDNPIFRAVPRAPLHCPVILSDRLSAAELTSSSVYRQAMRPSGIHHVMTVVVDIVDGGFVSLSLGRPETARDFDADEAALAARLGPHLAIVLRVQCELARSRGATDEAIGVLDAIDRGVVLTSSDGRISMMNRDAERLLAARDGLSRAHGCICAARPEDTGRLLALIARAADGVGGAMAVARPSLRTAYGVQVVPIAAARFAEASKAKAVLLIRDPDIEAHASTDLIMDFYGLSLAEAVLVLKLCDGASLRAAATAIGISPNTAKTQLKSVFDKLGIARQSQLTHRVSRDLMASR